MKMSSDLPYVGSLMKCVAACKKQLRLWVSDVGDDGVIVWGQDWVQKLAPIQKKSGLPLMASFWQLLMYLAFSHTGKYGITQNGDVVIIEKYNGSDAFVLDEIFFSGGSSFKEWVHSLLIEE